MAHCQFVYVQRTFPLSGSRPLTLPSLAVRPRPTEAMTMTRWSSPPTLTMDGLTYPGRPDSGADFHLSSPVSLS